MSVPLSSSFKNSPSGVLPMHSLNCNSLNSLLEVHRQRARLTKHNNNWLEIDVPYKELTRDSRRSLRSFFITYCSFSLVLMTIALVLVKFNSNVGNACFCFLAATLVVFILSNEKRCQFSRETVKLSSTDYCLIAKTITYSSLFKLLFTSSELDLESGEITETIVKEKTQGFDTFCPARVVCLRADSEVNSHGIKLGTLEFGRGLNFSELIWLVSEINTFFN